MKKDCLENMLSNWKILNEIKYEIDFYCNYFKDKKPFSPKVVENVSTASRHEYLPMISADNEILFILQSLIKSSREMLWCKKYKNLQ